MIKQNNNKTHKKFLIAAIIGNGLEYIDFMTFIFLAPLISTLFFPHLSLIFTYLVVTVSYLFRPIGGVILGNIGDKYGRRPVFSITLILMALSSIAISLLPTFNQAGYLAPLILILLRITQGCALGGELPGAVTYIVENLRHKNYFFYCATLTCGANLAIALSGQSIYFINTFYSHDFMYKTGWRILFLSGGFLAIFGIYLRKFVAESDEFIKLGSPQKHPFLQLLNHYKAEVFNGFLLCGIISITTSIFQVFLPHLLSQYQSVNHSIALNVSTFASTTIAISSLIIVLIAKYIHPLRIIYFSIIGLIITYMFIIVYGPELSSISTKLYLIYLIIFIIMILLSGINGLFLGLLAELFPTNIRYSGISFCFNTAYLFGAGFTPLWTSKLMDITHNYKYIIAICLIISILFLSMFKPVTSNSNLVLKRYFNE